MAQVAWSHSRIRTFKTCMRRYYYHYFLADNGWMESAGPERRKAYLLKKLSGLPLWTGDIVHTIIEHVIHGLRTRGELVTLDKARAHAVKLLRKGWVESVKGLGRRHPSKFLLLSEHYYGPKPSKEKCEEYKQRVLRCLHNFYHGAVMQRLRQAGPADYLTAEEFLKFRTRQGAVVSVKLDLAIRADGTAFLVDWKTGKPSADVAEQLCAYAMYAIKAGWAKDPEGLCCCPVYLNTEDQSRAMPEVPFTWDDLGRKAGCIQKEYEELVRVEGLKNDMGAFPTCDDLNECKWCPFREICEGAMG